MPKEVPINMQRKIEGRGKFLTAMLTIDFFDLLLKITIVSLATLYNPYVVEIFYGASPSSYVLWTGMSFILDMMVFVNIIRWKKVAAVTFFLLTGVEGVVSYTIFRPIYHPEPLLVSIIHNLVILGLWFWALKRKWRLFA